MVAVIDDEDWLIVNQFKWHVLKTKKGQYYAVTNARPKRLHQSIYMHRLIVGASPTDYVDHKDHCTLNNQRGNLRVCKMPQNIANSFKSKTNTSGFKGVSKIRNKWRAYIGSKDCKSWKHLGHFPTAMDAARAYDEEAVKRYGAFALTNKRLGLLLP